MAKGMARRWVAGLATALVLAGPGGASEMCTDDAMIVFDGSGSMSEMGFNRLGAPRIFEAREAIRKAVPGIAESRRLGLIIYGPGEQPACDNVNLRFSPAWDSAEPIIGEVESLWPSGATPLTEAVRQAAEVLDWRHRPGAVVLVTDGKETCGGTPCALAEEFARNGADFTVHVIGFKVRGDHFNWSAGNEDGIVSVARCLADGTGGRYETAETAQDLVAALRLTLGCNLYGALDDGTRRIQ